MACNEKLDNNLMSSLEGLTEEEVYGNIFVFNFAGHDATANSLAIGICLLATRPDVQEWIADEINTALVGVEATDSSYEATFPQNFDRISSVRDSNDIVIIPKNTVIIPNYSALHTHPRYWGHDSLEFEPSRRITTNPKISRSSSSNPVEQFKELSSRNSPFVGWSGGAHSCPGRKFAQVEFVGVLVSLFRDFKVKPVLLNGENNVMARARLLDQSRTDTGMKLLLQMLHPEKAVLEWSRR
ncbi:MAG: hypothetical protein Q9191_000462 [Dirinaria sp. TL-2023a]